MENYYWYVHPIEGGTEMISSQEDGGGVAGFRRKVEAYIKEALPGDAEIHQGNKDACERATRGYSSSVSLNR